MSLQQNQAERKLDICRDQCGKQEDYELTEVSTGENITSLWTRKKVFKDECSTCVANESWLTRAPLNLRTSCSFSD